MVYECDKCGAALPPGVRACGKCGEAFEDTVPADAEVPKRGFTAASPPPAAPPAPAAPPGGRPYPWLDEPGPASENLIVPATPAYPPSYRRNAQGQSMGQKPETLSVTRPVAGREMVYLQNRDVTITDTRAVMGGKTYAMANVTSVAMVKIAPDNSGGCVWGGIGVAVLVVGIAAQSFYPILIGALIVGAAWLIASQKKPKFLVRITAASSESNALWAHDPVYIQTVVDAVNQAIINRG